MCKTATCWSYVVTQVRAATPDFSSKEVHQELGFKARIVELKHITLTSSLMKDWVVSPWCKIRKREGCWVIRDVCQGVNRPNLYMSGSLCMFPECLSPPEPSFPILKLYPPFPHNLLCMYLCFHVICQESETPICGLQGFLSAAQNGLHKTGLRTVSKTSALKHTDGCCRAEASGTEMREGGVASWAFSVLVGLLCLSQSLIWKQLP